MNDASALFEKMMGLAVGEAQNYVGATTPNPPVGAVILRADGKFIASGCHKKAGLDHAEVDALKAAERAGSLDKAHTLIVTLEPCNHQGRTPPCTEAILKSPIKRVVIGIKDPNPQVAGGGAQALRSQSIEVIEGVGAHLCKQLAEGFISLATKNRPFITVKQAFDVSGSMIPAAGEKTFTSQDSLSRAHQWRRESDAIITGSGTVLADNPLFTVRHVQDHPGKKRILALLDRRGRVPLEWDRLAATRGLEVYRAASLEDAVNYLTQQRCLKVLVEAGPALTKTLLDSPYWDRHIEIFKGNPDRIEVNERLRL